MFTLTCIYTHMLQHHATIYLLMTSICSLLDDVQGSLKGAGSSLRAEAGFRMEVPALWAEAAIKG